MAQVIASVSTQFIGEISDETTYYNITEWENGTVTIESSEGDVIQLTPELAEALLTRILRW